MEAVCRVVTRSATVRGAGALTMAVVALWWLMPRVAGVQWGAVGSVLAGMETRQVLALAVVWLAGLLAHSFVLTNAMPGLSRRRALTLNLTGSAVSNVLPFGGAAGVALNLAMVRAWRFGRRAFGTFLIVTNAWDVLAKLVLPLVAAVALVTVGGGLTPAIEVGAGIAAILLTVLVATAVGLLVSDRVAVAVAGLLAVAAQVVLRRTRPGQPAVAAGLLEARAQVRSVITERWAQLTAGMGTYVALQLVLLWACLQAVGQPSPWTACVVALAVDRLLSLVPLTPAGTGVAELGTTAALVGLGADPLGAAAGVLLFRLFIVVLEIPVGGLWIGLWMVARRHQEANA
jgi:putative heme transporter